MVNVTWSVVAVALTPEDDEGGITVCDARQLSISLKYDPDLDFLTAGPDGPGLGYYCDAVRRYAVHPFGRWPKYAIARFMQGRDPVVVTYDWDAAPDKLCSGTRVIPNDDRLAQYLIRQINEGWMIPELDTRSVRASDADAVPNW
jgi:hypothetical protein